MAKPVKKNGAAPKVAPPPKDIVLTFRGRRFIQSARISMRQDARILDLTERSGLTAFFSEAAAKPNEPVKPDIVRGLIVECYRKGTLWDLLAALLREEGKEKWTQADADATAEMFAELDDPEEKARAYDAILELLLGFFVAARESWRSSQPSAATPSGPTLTPQSTLAPIAEPLAAVPGLGLSGASLGTTPATISSSPTGT